MCKAYRSGKPSSLTSQNDASPDQALCWIPISAEMGIQHKAWSGDASFCDVNEDGFPDLYALHMYGRDTLYENQGGKKFVDKTLNYFPRTPNGSMGIKFFDFNLDGKMDWFG